MVTGTRFVVAVAVLLHCRDHGIAQPPPAPPPHPTLDQVVKEYLRLGLPLPPPNAELVRLEWWKVTDNRTQESYVLGFRVTPQKPGDPRFLIDAEGGFWNDRWFEPLSIERAEPVPSSLDLVELRGEGDLCIAVQCELRGWHDLARALYDRSLECSVLGGEERSLIVQLRELAWELSRRLCWKRGTDRKATLRRLKELAAEEESLRTPWNERLLRQLELTLAPSKSKPGTIDALIDELTEYSEDDRNPSIGEGSIANRNSRPETTIVRVIGAKYPAQLPAIYRAMLRKPPADGLRDFATEIAASKLTREQKVRLFEEGVTHEDTQHRIYSLEGLAEVDPLLFRKHLLVILKELPRLTKGEKEEPRWWATLIALVLRADNHDCSDALVTAAKQSSIEFRATVISCLGPNPLSRFGAEIPHRLERVRILLQFLDDRSVEVDESDRTEGELCDFAASLLAELVGIRPRRVPEYCCWTFHNPERGPLSRLLLREAVWQAAKRELARDGK